MSKLAQQLAMVWENDTVPAPDLFAHLQRLGVQTTLNSVRSTLSVMRKQRKQQSTPVVDNGGPRQACKHVDKSQWPVEVLEDTDPESGTSHLDYDPRHDIHHPLFGTP